MRNNKMRWFHKEVLKLYRDNLWGYKSLDDLRESLDWNHLGVISADLFLIVDQISGVRSLKEESRDYIPVYLERVHTGNPNLLLYRPSRLGRRWLHRRRWLFKLIDAYHAVFGRAIPKTLGEGWL